MSEERPKRKSGSARTQSKPAPSRQKRAPESAPKGEAKRESKRAEKSKSKALEPEVVSDDESHDEDGASHDPEREVEELGSEADGAAVPMVLSPEIDEDETSLDGSPRPKTKTTDLSRADALTRYLSEISRHPLLTREEEHDLATRFSASHDPALAYRLVTANLRLVVKIAMEYRRAAFNVLDLIQEGNVGLMQAVQKYDPMRGVKLSSYSAWWIRAYILRYLMDNWRMVKLGTTQAQRKLFFNLRKEQEKLLQQGFEAAPKLLAEKLDVSEQDIRDMDQRLGNDELSIDAPMGGSDDSAQTYGDRLSEQARGADDRLGDEELRRVFQEHLAAFGRQLTSEKDQFLFRHRIAVPDGEEPMTLQQVGEKYGFTRERARQLEARLTDQLREFLRERMPDFAQLSVHEENEES